MSQVPVADFLRFSKFTIGHAWQGEYGFVSNREDFFNLISLSPYHTALAAADAPQESLPSLPSLLVTTADHDDRVVPLHSFKVRAQHTSRACSRCKARASHPSPLPSRLCL